MTQALYRKWRPRRWEAVVGQEHIIQTLSNAVAADRVAHAYLFAGPRGTGKTTTARILAKAVNCLHPERSARPCDECEHCQSVNAGRFLDLIEIDAASNTSVEDVRNLRDKINFSPNQGRYKVYIVDEVHMLSTAAFNALLKTLEEPPPHAIFVLATTEVHKIPATVLSRCQRHEFRRIPINDIIALLKEMAVGEKIQVAPDALTLIARQATGSMRDAISLLDQLASTGQTISLELAHAVLGTATSQAVLDVVEALLAGESSGLDHIHQALNAGSDPRQFARQIVDYLRQVLLIRMDNADQIDATADLRAQMARHAQGFNTPGLLDVIRAFNHAATDARATWQPALPLEMAFVDCLNSMSTTSATLPEPQTIPPTVAPLKPKTHRLAQTPPPNMTSPPDETPASEAESTAPDPSEDQAMQALIQNWQQLLSRVREQSPNLYGLLNSYKSRQLRGNVLILGFASDVLKNQMAKPDNREIVQQALTEILGREITLHCVISSAKRNTIPHDVAHDGMVAAAVRDLGGEIVNIQ